MESSLLSEINELSNRQHNLYRELGNIIQSGGLHLGSDQPQTIGIREIKGRLTQLWNERRAEGKYWMPRLKTSKYGEGYERPLRNGSHGYS